MSATETGAETLERLRIFSDLLDVDPAGMLILDGVPAQDLLERYGSPLVVTMERTVVDNYRRIRTAFEDAWAGPVGVLYSFKSNNTLAIRHLLSRIGAGGDCFGEGELEATLRSGADPRHVVLNGSDKSQAVIERAVAAGATVNVDGVDEIDFIAEACRATGRRCRASLRLKVLPEALSPYMSGSGLRHGAGIESVRHAKWGFTPEAARPLLERLLAAPHVDFMGFSCHIGHLSNRPEAFAAIAESFGEAVRALSEPLGYRPRVLDLGGGWAREREPEQRGPEMEAVTIEQQAAAACAVLRQALGPLAEPLPELWVEPGRYIVGNGQVLLATVGAVKADAGYRWAHVDASTNNLQRIETGSFHYHLLPASRMRSPCDTVQEVVGGTCFRSVLGAGRRLPSLNRGDIVAILDAGMYAEVFANQFNSMPRPASVMIGPGPTVDLIRERETVEDVFAHHRLPERFRKA